MDGNTRNETTEVLGCAAVKTTWMRKMLFRDNLIHFLFL